MNWSPYCGNPPATPHEAVDQYFGSLRSREFSGVRDDLAELHQNANPAFRQGYDSQFYVPTLVSEEPFTIRALEMLVRDSPEGEAIIINVNAPRRVAKSRQVQSRTEEIRQFVGDTRDVPMSLITRTYRAGTTIGRIMRDTYAVGMADALGTYGDSLPNMPMVRGDVDLVDMPPDYRPAIYREWKNMDGPGRIIAPLVLDELVPQFPNLNRLIQWNNLLARFGMSITPTHFAVDMHGYAGAGGQRADCAVAETKQLGDAMETVFGQVQEIILPHLVTVSARNLVGNVSKGRGYYNSLVTPHGRRATYRTQAVQSDISSAHYDWESAVSINQCAYTAFRAYLYRSRGSGKSNKERIADAYCSALKIGIRAVDKFGDSPLALETFKRGLDIELATLLKT